MTGTIYKVRLNLGYAFVRGHEDNQARFVYSGDVTPPGAFDTFHEGLKISFEPRGEVDVRPSAKNNGLRAIKVEICPLAT